MCVYIVIYIYIYKTERGGRRPPRHAPPGRRAGGLLFQLYNATTNDNNDNDNNNNNDTTTTTTATTTTTTNKDNNTHTHNHHRHHTNTIISITNKDPQCVATYVVLAYCNVETHLS